jgi:hypothetical protein
VKDILGNSLPIDMPHKFEYNRNEINITAIEKQGILLGMGAAFEVMLGELRLIRNPRKEILAAIAGIEEQLKEIDTRYGHFKPE